MEQEHEREHEREVTEAREERVCVVLAHGFNGEPAEMRELEGRLRAQGFTTRNLLLPGHGTTLREFAASRWEQWAGAIQMEARAALARGERVVLAGHSMGAAACLLVAAREPEVAGVAALCPPLHMRVPSRHLVRTLRRVLPYFPAGVEDVRDRRGARRLYRRRVYRWTSLAAAQSLFEGLAELRGALAAIRCPTLIMCARHDHVVPVYDGLEAYIAVGAAQRELVVLKRSFHAVTKDVERQLVLGHVERFCQRVAAGELIGGVDAADAHVQGWLRRHELTKSRRLLVLHTLFSRNAKK